MKFVKRISLFFIYPITMFGIGFCTHKIGEEIFYPGRSNIKSEALQLEEPIIGAKEVLVSAEAVITANTEYIIICHDLSTGKVEEYREKAPEKYIGFTRQQLEEEIKAYEESPSLTDLEKGFFSMELVSFAPERVMVRKNFEKKEEGFFLLNENHYVVVYDRTLMHVYMNTGIKTDELPQDLQEEIMHMKFISNENELYHFLESYSS